MRIISGSARGRILAGPKHPGLRPTSDRARQVCFDLLGQIFPGGDVLDLYCGTGSMALEALSRGASRALCVDSDDRALELTRANAAVLGFGPVVETRKAKLPGDLKSLPTSPRRLVFVDPPYEGAEPAVRLVLHWVIASGILAPDGVLVIETSRHSDFAETGQPELVRIAQRKVGEAVLHLYAREA